MYEEYFSEGLHSKDVAKLIIDDITASQEKYNIYPNLNLTKFDEFIERSFSHNDKVLNSYEDLKNSLYEVVRSLEKEGYLEELFDELVDMTLYFDIKEQFDDLNNIKAECVYQSLENSVLANIDELRKINHDLIR